MKKTTTRVLQVIPSTNYGGISSMIMNLYRNIDRDKLQFDFVSFNKGPLHEEIIKLGGRVFYTDYIKKQGQIAYVKKMIKIIDEYGPYEAIPCSS